MFRQHFLIAIVHATIVAGKGGKSKPEFDGGGGDATGQLILDPLPAAMFSFKIIFLLLTSCQIAIIGKLQILKPTADAPYWKSFVVLIFSLTTLLISHILGAVDISISYNRAFYGEHVSYSLFVAEDAFAVLAEILMIITLLTLLAYFRQHYSTTLSWDMPKSKFIFDVAVIALQVIAAICGIATEAANQTNTRVFILIYVTTVLIASLDVAVSAFALRRALKTNNNIIDPLSSSPIDFTLPIF
ncbi:hypothetical protein BDN72DRAFT_883031 [Pluteus cervinus]|uniref:Uncharacterized protein n=1 Tax=Pluteus cervinus TaxID=181527 RepID=A0ACD3A7V3_9AGAR|nr:hypothetical protein BDN72DRAFT_883031 [Pluteus cervinus]